MPWPAYTIKDNLAHWQSNLKTSEEELQQAETEADLERWKQVRETAARMVELLNALVSAEKLACKAWKAARAKTWSPGKKAELKLVSSS